MLTSGALALGSLTPDATQAGQAFEPKLGAQLIGKLEGPELIVDPAKDNPKQANEMLDKLGLTKRDAEGYRLGTDGKSRIRLELPTAAGSFIPHTQVCEMIKQQWKKIGIDADVKEVERNFFFTRINNNEQQIAMWLNNGTEVLYLFPRHALPVDPVEALLGNPIARWYASGGQQGKEPKDPQLRKALNCSARRPARNRRSDTRSPRRSGGSSWRSNSASARWASFRQRWVYGS